ncbi:DUF6063 family protein [Pseudomonas hefeiensis]|uniref:DUF6063 family protein n=1 Tax=Pseudomonas hefeiensis TaxID=2738125 RepID=A0ABY9GGD4_9PSED|nr:MULTISPECIES: DUF6063 family protein [unclassified Pseudomonas]WLH14727.1 DUF6063 family protein [Pseudomonas sp. FP205]WLH97782.1 DUF6063 family protein [Pseudomonas sp. FP53]WLI42056.1 DUF6063 family protein [Pseudomonas sp. FP821]
MDNQNSAAARLIYRALNLSATPANDVEYRELLARYRASPELQQVLAEIAEGMELVVLDVSERGLIIAPTRKESRFSIRLVDLRKNLSEDQRVALALSFLAICAVFYPTTALIEDDSRFPMPATLAMFRDTLTALSGRMNALEDSDDYSREELRPGWSYIHSLPVSIPQADRASPNSIEGLVRMALNYLIDYGLVNNVGAQDESEAVEYTATHRLRIQLRERTLPRLFDYVRSGATA